MIWHWEFWESCIDDNGCYRRSFRVRLEMSSYSETCPNSMRRQRFGSSGFGGTGMSTSKRTPRRIAPETGRKGTGWRSCLRNTKGSCSQSQAFLDQLIQPRIAGLAASGFVRPDPRSNSPRSCLISLIDYQFGTEGTRAVIAWLCLAGR
jgi:hypothetical protein